MQKILNRPRTIIQRRIRSIFFGMQDIRKIPCFCFFTILECVLFTSLLQQKINITPVYFQAFVFDTLLGLPGDAAPDASAQARASR